MKYFLEKIRSPQKGLSLKMQIAVTMGIIFFGFTLGVFQKWLDGSPSNILPQLFQELDIRNYFGRIAIWILLGTAISVYSRSPIRASVNTFCFFITMLAGYYLYSNYVLGFLPKTYMLIWIAISFASIFMAYICWYAKGEGPVSILISSAIIGSLFAQAFSLVQGFYMYNIMEVLTWLVSLVILYRKPKEFLVELGLSFVFAIICQMLLPHWG